MSDSRTTTDQFQLRTGLYLLPQGDDEIFVRTGSRAAFSKIIRDEQRRRLLTPIVRLSTQPTDMETLASQLQADVATIQTLVQRLQDEEVLVCATNPDTLAVVVIADGLIGQQLRGVLEAMPGIEVTDVAADAADDDLEADMQQAGLVVVATDGLRPRLNHEVNALSHDLRVPVLYSYADGPDVQVGPLVYPGETACYTCFEVQDEGARHLRDEFLIFKDDLARADHTVTISAQTAAMASAWLSLCIGDVAQRGISRLAERVVRVETERFEVASHRILQMPRCPECSRRRAELQHTFL